MVPQQIQDRAHRHAVKKVAALEEASQTPVLDPYRDSLIEGLTESFIDGFCDALRIVQQQSKGKG